MSYSFQCPHCGGLVQYLPGVSAPCPHCKKTFQMPAISAPTQIVSPPHTGQQHVFNKKNIPIFIGLGCLGLFLTTLFGFICLAVLIALLSGGETSEVSNDGQSEVAKLTGDHNDLHVNPPLAEAASFFKECGYQPDDHIPRRLARDFVVNVPSTRRLMHTIVLPDGATSVFVLEKTYRKNQTISQTGIKAFRMAPGSDKVLPVSDEVAKARNGESKWRLVNDVYEEGDNENGFSPKCKLNCESAVIADSISPKVTYQFSVISTGTFRGRDAIVTQRITNLDPNFYCHYELWVRGWGEVTSKGFALTDGRWQEIATLSYETK